MQTRPRRQFPVVKPSRNWLALQVTPRVAVVCVFMVGLMASLAFLAPRAWRWWEARPRSPAQQVEAIYDYLGQKSGRHDFKSSFDFHLREKVASLQSNAVRMRAELDLLQTNLNTLEKDVRLLGRESAAASDLERSAKRRLANIAERRAEQERRLGARQVEIALMKSNLTVLTTNELRPAARIDQWRRQLVAGEEAVTSLQTNLAALQGQHQDAESGLATAHAEANAKQTLLAKRQGELKTLNVRHATLQKEWQALRRECQAGEQSLANQAAEFTREMRRSIKEAGNYESIYFTVGRVLWTGERLLVSAEPRIQRQGAMFIDEAAQIAMRDAEDAGLAARICEGLVWPNLTRFDLPGQGTAGADAALGNCNGIIQRAGANHLLEKNYRLMLQYAPTARRADAIRYNLGYHLEQSGSWQSALDLYGQIQDTNLVTQAQRRMAAVEQKRSSAP